MPKMLTRCPVCDGLLHVAGLNCASCGTQVRGSFDTCRFCRAATEHVAFVETFLRCEGNLTRVEKELNISYPTVRNRLAAALGALGLDGSDSMPAPPAASTPPANHDQSMERRHVLEQLSSGSISPSEAAELLRLLT